MFYKIAVNPTLHTIERMFDNKPYVFKARNYIQVPTEIANFIQAEMYQMGIFIFKENVPLEQQELAALQNYLVSGLYASKYNWDRWFDEKKLGGVAVDKPIQYKAILHEIEEVEKYLKHVNKEEKLPTFDDFEKLQVKVSDETMNNFTSQWKNSLNKFSEVEEQTIGVDLDTNEKLEDEAERLSLRKRGRPAKQHIPGA